MKTLVEDTSASGTATSEGILGKVSSCTLSNSTKINVENRTYCAVDYGYKTQSQAIAHCKTLNARLPLPKSDVESDAFLKEFPPKIWIDITDPGSESRLPPVQIQMLY